MPWLPEPQVPASALPVVAAEPPPPRFLPVAEMFGGRLWFESMLIDVPQGDELTA